MMKYIFGLILIVKGFVGEGQTFAKSVGAIVGNQTVISIPIYAGNPTKQALIYYPDNYFKDTTKTFPVYFFFHGAGEAGTDIALVNKQSLPYLISHGLKPYNIDPKTGDTIKWIVISPQCSEAGGNCSYSYPQLRYTIPYCLQKFRINKNCVWGGGLSMGGSATFSLGMADTGFTMTYMTGLMPFANAGWDQNINNATYKSNFIYSLQHGLKVLYVIGDQDPGYNPNAFDVYNKLMASYALPGFYMDSVIKGGTHSANVWNTPFPFTSRLWSKTQNSWDLMWSLRKNSIVVTPPPVIINPPPVPVDTTKKVPYILKICVLMSDSTTLNLYSHP